MGTNTFHLLIADVKQMAYNIIYRDRKPVKIGEKGINKGEITPEAWRRGITTLNTFNEIIKQHGVNLVFATATSAVRNANNGKLFAEEVQRETGIEVEIISGIREAELIHLGAGKAIDFGENNNLIMDIGGGSIEFIITNNREVHWLHSFEIGGQRLVENFHKTDPITQAEINNLCSFFESELQPLFEAGKTFTPNTLIGCSGTFDTLSDIYRKATGTPLDPMSEELPLKLSAFNEIYQDLIKKTREERLQIPGMIEMRVEMIVVASVLVDFIIKRLNLTNIRVSAYALKEGILFNALDQIRELEKLEK